MLGDGDVLAPVARWVLRSLGNADHEVPIELAEGGFAVIGRGATAWESQQQQAAAAGGSSQGSTQSGSPALPSQGGASSQGGGSQGAGVPGRLPLGISSRAVSRKHATLTQDAAGALHLKAESTAGPTCLIRGSDLHALFAGQPPMQLLASDIIAPRGNNLLKVRTQAARLPPGFHSIITPRGKGGAAAAAAAACLDLGGAATCPEWSFRSKAC